MAQTIGKKWLYQLKKMVQEKVKMVHKSSKNLLEKYEKNTWKSLEKTAEIFL